MKKEKAAELVYRDSLLLAIMRMRSSMYVTALCPLSSLLSSALFSSPQRSLTPVWNETFEYYLIRTPLTLDTIPQVEDLDVSVWDFDRIAKDEYLGGIRFVFPKIAQYLCQKRRQGMRRDGDGCTVGAHSSLSFLLLLLSLSPSPSPSPPLLLRSPPLSLSSSLLYFSSEFLSLKLSTIGAFLALLRTGSSCIPNHQKRKKSWEASVSNCIIW